MSVILAVDFGGTNIRVARFENGQPPSQAQIKTPTRADEGPEAVLQRLKQSIAELLPDDRADTKIGIGAPAPVDPYRGFVLRAPNLPGWKDIPLQKIVGDEFNVPVRVGNDANVAALGEWKFGAGRGSDNLIYLTISTGIGGGIITDGRLLLGSHGLGAELGHMTLDPNGPLCGCGQRGHIEAIAAGPAIAERAVTGLESGSSSSLNDIYSRSGRLEASDVGQAALSGDEFAIRIVQETGTLLGIHMANLTHAFNPETFVLGGGVSQIGSILLEAIESSLRQHVMDPAYLDGLRIVPAELGDNAGLVGAMVLATQG
ncbi:MAG: ROK family protein [Anaerolineales bacterium]|jgi:glucokinase